MNKLIVVLSLCLNTSVFALDFLSESQKEVVLREIDNICGDTWCEGDFNFSFDKISCDSDSKSCVLEMKLFDGYSEEDESTVYYNGACTIEGPSDYSDIIEKNGDWDSLKMEFYELVTDCVSDLEEKAREVLDLGI